MSEMGTSEYKTRLKQFGDSLTAWKSVMAASMSYDFDGAIEHHNSDGLTCIDFLEEIDGEYFRIASSIRDIYDAIGNGVAFIAIQKKTDSNYGRGGQATTEKARLYMSLDYLATQENSIICALKIIKVKHFLNKNLQNHEIHFRLENGCNISPVTDWMQSSKVNRDEYINNYENSRLIINDPSCSQTIYFKTVCGKNVKINGDDMDRWQLNFRNINVQAELEKVASRSFEKPFLKKSNYFFQLAGILAKKDRGE